MAISGKTAAPFEMPYFFGSDHPPDMAALSKAMAERTAQLLGEIAPSQIVGGSAGKLIIAGSTGAGAYKAMSGDATITEAGALTIGAGKVTDAKLASPNNQIPRTLFSVNSTISSAKAEGFYRMSNGVSGGSLLLNGAEVEGVPADLFQLKLEDYLVAGKTAKWRVVTEILTNGTKPTNVRLIVGFHPLEASAGGSNKLGPAFQVSEGPATGEIEFINANVGITHQGAWVTVPSSSQQIYAMGLQILGAPQPANSVIQVGAHLQIKWE